MFHIVLGDGAPRQELRIETTRLDSSEYSQEEPANSEGGAETGYAEVELHRRGWIHESCRLSKRYGRS